MPQLFPSRSDFTLTSPILCLTPEQRRFPHFVTSYLDGAAELFIVYLFTCCIVSLLIVFVYLCQGHETWRSLIGLLVEPLRSLDECTRGFACMKGWILLRWIIGRPFVNWTYRSNNRTILFREKPERVVMSDSLARGHLDSNLVHSKHPHIIVKTLGEFSGRPEQRL